MTKKKRLRKLAKQAQRSESERTPHARVQLTFSGQGILIESSVGFRYITLGGIKLARPRVFTESKVRKKAEEYLRKKYSSGVYRKSDEISEILNYQVAYFETQVDQVLRRLASLDCLHFLFAQYDASKEIENLYKAGKLSVKEASEWDSSCSYTRRAFKFLCERIVLLKPQVGKDAEADEGELPTLYEEAIICAEELVALSMHSDQTRYLFPENSVFTILPRGNDFYWDLSLDDPELSEAMTNVIRSRIRADAKVRDNYFTGKPFDQDWEKHEEIIGDAFEIMSGMRYEKAIRALSILPKMCTPGNTGICCIPKEKLIEGAALNLETKPEAILKVFSGFWLTSENMRGEARNFWNPKNVYRAYRRGLFEIGSGSDTRLTWSEAMFVECWFMLMMSVAYGIVPPEWRHPDLQTALGRLKNECGAWFEKVVRDQVKALGMQAICSRKGFGQGSLRMESSVGEIDLIAYSEKEHLLVIGESKMTMNGAEPKFFRDELEDFVRKEKSFANKFRKKVNWSIENLPALCQALNSSHEFSCAIEPVEVAPIMVTFVPSIAKHFIPDFPCVALSELTADYNNAGRWPYSKIAATG